MGYQPQSLSNNSSRTGTSSVVVRERRIAASRRQQNAATRAALIAVAAVILATPGTAAKRPTHASASGRNTNITCNVPKSHSAGHKKKPVPSTTERQAAAAERQARAAERQAAAAGRQWVAVILAALIGACSAWLQTTIKSRRRCPSRSTAPHIVFNSGVMNFSNGECNTTVVKTRASKIKRGNCYERK
jgi:hypothetical protein